jgi:hypothetical protein
VRKRPNPALLGTLVATVSMALVHNFIGKLTVADYRSS